MTLDLSNYTDQQKAIIEKIENTFINSQSMSKQDFLIALNFLYIKHGGKK